MTHQQSLHPINAQARLGMYQLLARGFSYPSEEFYQALETGAYGEYMSQATETLGFKLDREHFADAGGLSLTDLESAYLQAFELNVPKKSCSLYAGSYLPGTERGGVLLAIRQIFKQFDITPDPKQAEPADFLVNELEFMQFLVAKELQANALALDSKPYCWAQSDFVKLHLALWIPAFSQAVEESPACSFYCNLARVLARFIHWEESYAIRRIAEIGHPPKRPVSLGS